MGPYPIPLTHGRHPQELHEHGALLDTTYLSLCTTLCVLRSPAAGILSLHKSGPRQLPIRHIRHSVLWRFASQFLPQIDDWTSKMIHVAFRICSFPTNYFGKPMRLTPQTKSIAASHRFWVASTPRSQSVPLARLCIPSRISHGSISIGRGGDLQITHCNFDPSCMPGKLRTKEW